MSELQAALQLLMADRHSAEARQFFERLLRYIEARAGSVTRTAWSDLLSPEEVEEVVAEVLKRLMTGALDPLPRGQPRRALRLRAHRHRPLRVAARPAPPP
jgi:hypothetical protein